MPNKTISIPGDLIPIIESLDVPFSTWVATQLRHHAAHNGESSFAQQLLADAQLASEGSPSSEESLATVRRMDRSAPW